MVYNIPIVSNVKDFELFQNMSEQTHLLIGGATGSGKSVIINGFICNLLLKSPNQAQFVLIDPKRVELVTYKNVPHCLKYASEQGEILTALKGAINLIENRYKKMQADGACVRYHRRTRRPNDNERERSYPNFATHLSSGTRCGRASGSLYPKTNGGSYTKQNTCKH